MYLPQFPPFLLLQFPLKSPAFKFFQAPDLAALVWRMPSVVGVNFSIARAAASHGKGVCCTSVHFSSALVCLPVHVCYIRFLCENKLKQTCALKCKVRMRKQTDKQKSATANLAKNWQSQLLGHLSLIYRPCFS